MKVIYARSVLSRSLSWCQQPSLFKQTMHQPMLGYIANDLLLLRVYMHTRHCSVLRDIWHIGYTPGQTFCLRQPLQERFNAETKELLKVINAFREQYPTGRSPEGINLQGLVAAYEQLNPTKTLPELLGFTSSELKLLNNMHDATFLIRHIHDSNAAQELFLHDPL